MCAQGAADDLAAMQACVTNIRGWMLMDRLMLNDDKTEFIILGTRQQLPKANIDSLRVGNATVPLSSEVKNLRCKLHSQLKINTHIDKT